MKLRFTIKGKEQLENQTSDKEGEGEAKGRSLGSLVESTLKSLGNSKGKSGEREGRREVCEINATEKNNSNFWVTVAKGSRFLRALEKFLGNLIAPQGLKCDQSLDQLFQSCMAVVNNVGSLLPITLPTIASNLYYPYS